MKKCNVFLGQLIVTIGVMALAFFIGNKLSELQQRKYDNKDYIKMGD